jgi:UDP-GlcNAc:undecaprenyl-phosphate GlcNAc-1-phosphate transferase
MAALAAAALLTPAVARLARTSGFLDQPAARKLHAAPTPLLGGLAVALAASLGGLFAVGPAGAPPGAALLLGGGLVAFAVGLWDDRRGLGVWPKLAGQGVAAGLLLASGAAPELGLPAPAGAALVWLGVVGLMNAVNFLDNMNGVVGGLAAIALAAFAWGALQGGAPAVAAGQAALAGACLGFLPYNFPRGRIFLGDAGSLLLGYSLAASVALALGGLPRGWGRIGPLFLIAYPLFDATFVLVNRWREGRPLHAAGLDHSNHRLSTLLRCPKRTPILIWLAGAALCASGLAVQELNRPLPSLALSVLWGATLGLAGWRLSAVASAPAPTPRLLSRAASPTRPTERCAT